MLEDVAGRRLVAAAPPVRHPVPGSLAGGTQPTLGSRGVASWEASVPLGRGLNVFRVPAFDLAGNEAIDTVQVGRE